MLIVFSSIIYSILLSGKALEFGKVSNEIVVKHKYFDEFGFFNLFVAVIIGEMQKLQEAEMREEIHEDSLKLDILLKEMKALREEVNNLRKEKQ